MSGWAISTEVISQRLGNDTVVVHLGSNRIYQLNETGTKLWESLGTCADLAQIEVQLAAEYEVDPETLALEAQSLLDRLIEERLVVIRG